MLDTKRSIEKHKRYLDFGFCGQKKERSVPGTLGVKLARYFPFPRWSISTGTVPFGPFTSALS